MDWKVFFRRHCDVPRRLRRPHAVLHKDTAMITQTKSSRRHAQGAYRRAGGLSMGDAFKTAEKRGYSKDTRAGRRRSQRDQELKRRADAERAFWERTSRRWPPRPLRYRGWRLGERPITSSEDRAKLAAAWADRAVEERRRRYG